MDERDEAVAEVERRLRSLFAVEEYGIKRLKVTPTRPIEKSDCPAILIDEGKDSILKRSPIPPGYPMKRNFELLVEVWDLSDTGDVKTLRKKTIQKTLAGNGVLDSSNKVTIKEKETIGPSNGDIPGILGMQIVFEILYTDRTEIE